MLGRTYYSVNVFLYTDAMARSSTAEVRSNVPARRASNHVTGSSATQTAILGAARKALVAEGSSRLTLRRVAEIAGIAVGNLTYHFPSKRKLIRALIEDLIADYSATVEAFFNDPSMSPEEELKTMVEWLITDSASRATSRIFRELWVMALHDPYVARAVDDFYDETMARGVRLLLRSQPGLTDASARALVHLIVMTSEGANAVYGTRTRATSLQDTIALAVELFAKAANGQIKPEGRK